MGYEIVEMLNIDYFFKPGFEMLKRIKALVVGCVPE